MVRGIGRLDSITIERVVITIEGFIVLIADKKIAPRTLGATLFNHFIIRCSDLIQIIPNQE